MNDFAIAPNFKFFELTRTEQRDLIVQNRRAALADPIKLAALAAGAWGILQPIRDHFGKPVFVHSGGRFHVLNSRVGGADDSDHLRFAAFDFHVSGVDLVDVFEFLRFERHGLRLGQVILENPDGGEPDWIHVALPYPLGKHQAASFWTYDGTKYAKA